MSKLRKNLENPKTSNIIADALAKLALISVTLSKLGFTSHTEHATAFTEALAGELDTLADEVSQSHSDALKTLLDDVENLYNNEGEQ